MDVILLERITNLGNMGDIVHVTDGYARNYLLSHRKALRANKANMEYFEGRRSQLEAHNTEQKIKASSVAERLNGKSYFVIRSAGDTGQLYGSVTARDIVSILAKNGFSIGRRLVKLEAPIKVIGLHRITIVLHPEIKAKITMNVTRSKDEAMNQESDSG
ncbi:50S ribosomal protein L9 [Candidatus Endowatersipora endosymbiont of Watersipora subatra]|uniref:50S ribosomal protein L9 n=1 Tax=Candidatus Endowatersipora endosymbiont of Watersipora subatra TaxID=3077946 RepID=UPI00312C7895